ncbi:MAG TPA: lysylphosphatidylglycerol synthase transmembrane domain-containing protein [Gammaproteobacteria bacterium]|nr:lysylphosphatidylglycerol synthase transmembrane domain-containing protein [Gammaproteobacteria bacterium]
MNIVVIFLVFLGAAYLIVKNEQDFSLLFSQLNWWVFFLILPLQIPLIGLGGYPFKVLIAKFGYILPWREWMGLSFIATLLNQILPYRPGIAFRYFYLKKKFHLPLSLFSLATMLYMLMVTFTSALWVFIPSFFVGLPKKMEHEVATGLIYVLFLIIILIFTHILLRFLTQKNLLHRYLKRFTQSYRTLFASPQILFLSWFIICFIQLLSVLTFYLTFMSLNYPILLGHCFFLVGITTLSLLFPLTPGNIGILETAIGGLTHALYNNFGLGFSAMLLYRLAQLSVSLIGGSLFSFILLKHFLPAQKDFSKMGKL